MSFNIINELLKAKNPKKRLQVILDQHAKNVKYFKAKHPELGNLLAVAGAGRFHVHVTPDFLEITDRNTGQFCHPQGKLLDYIKTLGAWHHDQWIDKLQVAHTIMPGIEHGDKLLEFLEKVHESIPEVYSRMQGGEISLPRTRDGKRYSSTTVFLGVGTGLHIVHYLNNTYLRDLILIEPDIDSFCLSTYFIDYAEIDKRLRLVLHVGPDMPESQLDTLFGESPITISSWLRILPAYPSGDFANLTERLHLRWRALTEIMVPFDREVRNLCYGMRNIKAKLPINATSPTLSTQSRIAVVGSGPSLTNDLPWLKANQDKLIIFAAHSSIKALKKHGIRPDFQCSLDTEADEELMDKLDFYPDIPYVSYYKADPAMFRRFKQVFLVNDGDKANAVNFFNLLHSTHPTTGNLATSVAIFCQPSEIYFLGLDLGFKDFRQGHVSEYWLGEEDVISERIQAAQAVANFPESAGTVYTQAYYNSARMGIEGAIKPFVVSGKKVFNLADGVRIEGAEAVHSSELELSAYPEKHQDILKIMHEGFSTDSEKLWTHYQNSGDKLLETTRHGLETAISFSVKKFDWLVFSRLLDASLRMVVGTCIALEKGDFRIEAYHRFLSDLLTEWYRIMIFTRTPSETQILYEAGLKAIVETLQTLAWPDELDESSVSL